MSWQHKESDLGKRKDFWNMNVNPITGFKVKPGYHNPIKQELKHVNLTAEYNF
ncbi:MAG: hypothetical protein Tsb0033_27800 [Winogradskyella sp.]